MALIVDAFDREGWILRDDTSCFAAPEWWESDRFMPISTPYGVLDYAAAYSGGLVIPNTGGCTGLQMTSGVVQCNDWNGIGFGSFKNPDNVAEKIRIPITTGANMGFSIEVVAVSDLAYGYLDIEAKSATNSSYTFNIAMEVDGSNVQGWTSVRLGGGAPAYPNYTDTTGVDISGGARFTVAFDINEGTILMLNDTVVLTIPVNQDVHDLLAAYSDLALDYGYTEFGTNGGNFSFTNLRMGDTSGLLSLSTEVTEEPEAASYFWHKFKGTREILP